MKRMNKNAIALATAGALTLAVAPAAMAQDAETIGDLNPNASETFVPGNAPENPAGEPDGPTVNVPGGATWGEDIAPSEPAEATAVSDLKTTTPAAPRTAPLKNAKCGDTYYYRHADGLNYVTDPNRTTGALPGSGWRSYKDILEDGDCIFVEDGNVQGPVEPGEAAGPSAGDIAKAVAAVAAAAVGTAIIINGVKYFVNKDKQTLVQDPNRVNAEPSAEEKAHSEELVKANPNTVASQTGASDAQADAGNAAAAPAANGERGIGASTGVNKLPAGIVSLLLASLLGAAAFVFGRRQLV